MSRASINPAAIDAMLRAGQAEAARAQLARHLQRHPADADAAAMMSGALARLKQEQQAAFYAQRAVEIAGNDPARLVGVGAILAGLRRTADAAVAYQRAARARPQDLDIRLALLNHLYLTGALADAASSAEQAQGEIDRPQIPLLRSFALSAMGRADEAERVLAESLARFPGDQPLTTARAANANYCEHLAAPEVFQRHADYGRLLQTAHPTTPPPFRNSREPDRRLRIGIVSADLRTHSITFYIEAFMRHADRAAVEIVCYSTLNVEDSITARLKTYASLWRDASSMNDRELAEQMRRDNIDIALDLMGHCYRHSLRAFHLHAAPVQASYMGYPNTTGVPAVDARIVDSLTDPPGAEALATERLIRIDPCFLCYTPPPAAPPVSDRPGDAPVVFGSFNNLAKIGDRAIALWTRVLDAVPASRLVIKNLSLRDAGVREMLRERLAGHGVPMDRLELLEPPEIVEDHLKVYSQVDIALDTFPYNGTTTTCEALWMGVPVVALEGPPAPDGGHAGRVGLTLLSAVGRREWVGATPDDYAAIAAALASDRGSLASIRRSLRAQVAASVLCDGPAFAQRFSGALRALWRDWCAGPPQS
ncbi:MAG: hypothetical protein KF745_08960 [Phycisphaeraceae bacterium]|nr:hypothetical protein [Phycisphaeraceae bacterium]